MHTSLVTCAICDKQYKFISNTHLKTHNLTIEEYRTKFPKSKIWSDELRHTLNISHKGKTYEEIMGKERAEQIRNLRSVNATRQMKNSEQIKIRKEKCGLAKYYTEERKSNMSKASTKEVTDKRYKTILKKYGSYEASMQKAFPAGNGSKSAKKYIEQFLIDNNINPSRCFYAGGGHTGNEYYQIIDLHDKKKVVMYDLVVFKNLEFKEIELILEYNGPWHYTISDVIERPDDRSVWFLTNSCTIKASYEKDIAKLNHALTLTKNVYIYWQKQKQIKTYDGQNY